MPRPKRHRIIQRIPDIRYFKPQGVPLNSLTEVSITMGEFEALRLKHYEGLNQTNCSKKMHISQSTFSRILENVHKKLTSAFIEGKAIKFQGGKFLHLFLGYGCLDCDHEWEMDTGKILQMSENPHREIKDIIPDPSKNAISCPKCKSSEIYKLKKNAIKKIESK